eukprot:6566483-Prymnesium_polylepis.3
MHLPQSSTFGTERPRCGLVSRGGVLARAVNTGRTKERARSSVQCPVTWTVERQHGQRYIPSDHTAAVVMCAPRRRC